MFDIEKHFLLCIVSPIVFVKILAISGAGL